MENSPSRLEKVAYHSEATGLERDYFVYLPLGFEEKDHWPVILFLHGNGERGDGKADLDYLLVHGPLFEAWSQKRNLPFIIIAPQLPVFNQGDKGFIKNRKRDIIPYPNEDSIYPYRAAYTGTEPMNGIPADSILPYPKEGQEDGWDKIDHELLSMLDHVLLTYKGDPGRVYLTGLSTGGFGVWYIGATYPERFAAIAPINAFGHPDLAHSLAKSKLPIWCITGGRDPYVKIQYFYPLLNKLESLGHPEVRFTIHEDMGHIAWQRAYSGNDLYDWFLSHTKP
ncbi:MAG: alpha/beta hydrolase [Saprospiraceae bacterium]|nr:alpha/beta hydrolase [Saprospiraceae bacterium]